MKKLLVLPFLLVLISQVSARQKAPVQPALIPVPVKAQYGQGFVTISKQTAINAGSELKYEVAFLNALFLQYAGYTLPVIAHTDRPAITSKQIPCWFGNPKGIC